MNNVPQKVSWTKISINSAVPGPMIVVCYLGHYKEIYSSRVSHSRVRVWNRTEHRTEQNRIEQNRAKIIIHAVLVVLILLVTLF